MSEQDMNLVVAAIVRAARLELGYTQLQVSEMADISFGEYQRIEYGQRALENVSFKRGLALCKVLRLDPYLLIFRETEW